MRRLGDLCKSRSSSIPVPSGNVLRRSASQKSPLKSGSKRSFLPVRITIGGAKHVQSQTKANNSKHLSDINSETEPETVLLNAKPLEPIDTKPIIPVIHAGLNKNIKILAWSMSNLSKSNLCGDEVCGTCWLLGSHHTRSVLPSAQLERLKCKYLKCHKSLDDTQTDSQLLMRKSMSSFDLFSNVNGCNNEVIDALIRHFCKNDSFEQKCGVFSFGTGVDKRNKVPNT